MQKSCADCGGPCTGVRCRPCAISSGVMVRKSGPPKPPKTCADCGSVCTGARCRSCVTTRKHGRSRYFKHGCRCDVCVEDELAYRQNAVCADCGEPCTRAQPRKGWTPPKETRCRSCYHKSRRRPPKRCQCGNEMDVYSTTCRPCWQSREGGHRRRDKVWLRATGSPELKTAAWRKLRLEVLQEEPECRIRIPGVCTEVSTTVDHIIPWSKDPTLLLVRSNLQGACMPCNRAMSNRGLRGYRLRIYPPHLAVAKVKEVKPPPVPRPCPICQAPTIRPKYCSSACYQEANARMTRDRYRAKVGLAVNPQEPVKSGSSQIFQR